MNYDEATRLLEKQGQKHLLRFWDMLDEGQRCKLLEQISDMDFEAVARMRELLEEKREQSHGDLRDIEPADVVDLRGEDADGARLEGEAALARGEVGAIVVAGGQGSRLGFEGPKGCFPIGPVSDASLFEIHARKILALERQFSTTVPFYVMTSRANDADTRTFFGDNAFFGLDPEGVNFFVQGMWPALNPDGSLVLDAPDHVFMSPDGHGGVLAALKKSGMLDDMANRGLKTIFYFQVDNPLIEIADPVFIGAHRLRNRDMSVKVCAKRDPSEGLGVVARRGGREMIVEYTELTEAQRNAQRADGKLKFLYGSVAIHVFSTDFLARAVDLRLPLHLAHKKVPFCDENGATVKPDKPNAYKFEKFIFDALPFADRVLNLAFRREEEFAPVKNASGNDSPGTAREAMIRKDARRLEACGVEVPVDEEDGTPVYKIEIDPCFAPSDEILKKKLPQGFQVDDDLLLRDW